MSDQGPSVHRRRRHKEWVDRESAAMTLDGRSGSSEPILCAPAGHFGAGRVPTPSKYVACCGRRASDEAHTVWLATVRSDGRPHVAPVWLVYIEDRLWIGTGLTSVRVRNLRSNPAASACLERVDEPVVAEGTVLIHEAVRPATVVEAFRTKYNWGIPIDIDNAYA